MIGVTFRVLVVDDNADHRYLTCRALRPLAPDGVHVEAVSGGDEALATLRAGEGALPDLVLLDIKMPDLDGFEVLRLLRSDARLRDLRVVMFTSSESDAERAQAQAEGADGFLTKPLDAKRFVASVRALVRDHVRSPP